MSESTRHRYILLATVLAVGLLVSAGCGRDATNANADVRANDMRDAGGKGDRQSVERLIDGLEDDSELVRREAQRGLSDVLKRQIYFDPSASADQRARQLEGVQKMWQNLQERDLVDAVQNRVPTQYYYDLNTGELFEDVSQPGPIETASGPHGGMPAGVRTVVLACRDCGDETDRYVGWLEVPAAALEKYGVAFKTTAELNTRLEIDRRRPFRRVQGGDWAIFGTSEAEAIAAEGRRCDNRKAPLMCRPGR